MASASGRTIPDSNLRLRFARAGREVRAELVAPQPPTTTRIRLGFRLAFGAASANPRNSTSANNDPQISQVIPWSGKRLL